MKHFVNLPRDATGLDDNGCPMAEECVVTAIEEDVAVLASSDATGEEKLAANGLALCALPLWCWR